MGICLGSLKGLSRQRFSRRADRELKSERCPDLWLAGDLDLASMQMDDLMYQVKTDAYARPARRL